MSKQKYILGVLNSEILRSLNTLKRRLQATLLGRRHFQLTQERLDKRLNIWLPKGRIHYKSNILLLIQSSFIQDTWVVDRRIAPERILWQEKK